MAKERTTPAGAGAKKGPKVTTLKAYEETTARLIREIGQLMGIKQEAALALFNRQFEDHLLTLLKRREKELRDKKDSAP